MEDNEGDVGVGSPSDDLYSDLFVEDVECQQRKAGVTNSSVSALDNPLQRRIAELLSQNAALTSRNAKLTNDLAMAEKLRADVERKFLAFRSTANDELRKKQREISEIKIALLKEKKWSRERRMEEWERRKVRERRCEFF